MFSSISEKEDKEKDKSKFLKNDKDLDKFNHKTIPEDPPKFMIESINFLVINGKLIN
jgi:hypothetical protein